MKQARKGKKEIQKMSTDCYCSNCWREGDSQPDIADTEVARLLLVCACEPMDCACVYTCEYVFHIQHLHQYTYLFVSLIE